MKILAALYDSYTQAQAVVQELIDAGFSRDMISIVANNADNRTGYSSTGTEPMSPSGAAGGFADNRPENYAEGDAVTGSQGAGFGAVVGTLVALGALLIPGVGPIVAAGPLAVALGAGVGAAAGAVTGGITASLVKTGISDEDAAYYEEGIRSGGTLVTIEVADDDADDARRIMDRAGATNIDERSDYASSANYSTSSGYSTTSSTDVDVDSAAVVPADTQFATTTSTTTTTTNTDVNNVGARTIDAGEEARLQVVEEDIAVGKRAVERGGVRVYQTVSERPVEEQVRLREERVVVERHPVNQPVDPSAINNFQEGVIEVTERGEEAVVQKTARVVEEVVVGKEATERTETVRDTVRRTDVQVEQIPVGSAYSAYETNFRSDYDTNYASSGVAFDPDYNNAYRYGYDLANNQQYAGYDWDRLESTARSDWERRYPNNAWDRFSGAVRSAWNQATGRY